MSTPLTKTDALSTDLYPDVVNAGGLPARLDESLKTIGSTLRVSSFNGMPVAYARVENQKRFSQTYLAAASRLFMPDFWSEGVCLAHFATDDVDDAARAIDFWVAGTPTTKELSSRFPRIRVSPSAQDFENGTAVEAAWQFYLGADPSSYPGLLDFIRAAYDAPELRSLFPFTSLNRFCFSTCTGYPYSSECPIVTPTRDGRFLVHPRHGESLIEPLDPLPPTSAEEAVRLVIQALPPGTGRARAGTAEDREDLTTLVAPLQRR